MKATKFRLTLYNNFLNFAKEMKCAPVEKLVQTFIPKFFQKPLTYYFHTRISLLETNLREQICTIVEENKDARAVVVFAPSLDWHRQLFQRPQQLAFALANQGALVFYNQITPLPEHAKIEKLSTRLFLCSIPLDLYSGLNHYFVYVLTWNKKFLLKFDRPSILYDYLDDISTFEGNAAQLLKDHRSLLRDSDLVIATAHELVEKVKHIRSDTIYIPNGVDFSHFDPSSPNAFHQVDDLGNITKQGKPIVGYYGALASWFDYDLLTAVAKMRRDLNFILIGPKYDDSFEKSGICNLPNIIYLGPKPYDQLPYYLANFDVAILPFRINEITQSTSPIKLFEYFAGGKPVVSTALKEVIQYPVALIGKDSYGFSQQLDKALLLRNNADYIERVKRTALGNTWDKRAEQILIEIENRQTIS